MVSIFTGAGAGFERGSGSVLGGAGLLGGASLGRSGEQLFLNAATGNLLIGQRDEFLVGRGPDAAISRTYNSLGDLSDENGDNWRQGTDRRIYGLTGSVNSAGSTVKRVSADGSEIAYGWNGSAYVATDGAGAHDQLTYSGGVWTWTDGSSQMRETYSAYGSQLYWRINQQIDADGNALTFGYTDDKLTRVTTADGGYVDYVWSGSNVTQITTGSHGTALTRTRYAYDGYNRLSSVTVDLSPGDHSIGDGNGYTTSYTYHGASKLVASISQTDGSSVSIGYDGSNRVTSLVQTVASGVTRATTIGYGAGYTNVTDAAGQVTTLEYNGDGSLKKITAPPAYSGASAQVVQFGYNGNGDVASVTDAAGATTWMGYDGMGNVVSQTDRLGNVVTRTYGAKNELLTETRVGSDKDSGAAYHTTRYVYDAENHLRYVVSADGNVSEIRYDGFGQALFTLEYTGQRYDVSGLGASTALAEWQLNNWVAALADPTAVKQVENRYDARGNLSQQISYGSNVTTADGYTHAYFTYDQAGQLLSRTTASLNTETFVYDGLGRITASTDVRGGTTSFVFHDASTQTVVTLAGGLVQTSTYNKAGELVAFTESGNFTAGGTASYKYDQNGRLRQATDATGFNTYYLYDKAGRKIAEVNHHGHLTEYRYDARDRLVATARYTYGLSGAALSQLADPGSNVEMASIRPAEHSYDIWTWTVYDQEGRVIEAIDGDGGVTAYDYDASGRLVRTTSYANKLAGWQVAGFRSSAPTATVLPPAHGNDKVARSFYDKDGRLIGVLDGEGYLSRTVYDAAGQKVQEIAYANAANPAYRAGHSLQTLIDTTPTSASDRSARYVYDGQGLLRFAIDGLNQVTEYGYESNVTWGAIGPVRKLVRYAGSIAALGSYTYASVRSAINAAGLAGHGSNRTSWQVYDAANRLAYDIDATGAVTGYAYNVSGQVVRTTRYANLRVTSSLPTQSDMDAWAGSAATASDRITRSFYTDRGELKFQVDAEGYVTRYDHDAEGRVTAEIRWDGAISIDNNATIWTVNGSVGGASRSNSFTYDATGKVAYAYDGEGNHRHYSYYANGTLAWDIAMYGHADESRTLYVYDAAGRVIAEYKAYGQPEQAVTQYGYDGHGNLVSVTDPRGNVTTRTYDKLGQVLTETNAAGTVSYQYNAFDEAVKVTDARGFSTYSYYDRLGRVIATRDAEDYVTETGYSVFGDVQTVTRRYNRASNAAAAGALPTYAAHAQDAVTSFEYDKLGRVVKTTDAEGHYEQYTLDAWGNRVSVRNKIGGVVTNAYDRRGLLVAETLPMASYDNNGSVVAWSVTNKFEYDARGNRTRKIEAHGLPEQRNTYYAYDKADRLIETRKDAVGVLSQADHNSLGTVTPTERFKYDVRGNVVETVDANGARTLFYYDRLNRKVADLNAVGTLSTYAYDKNGNVIASRVYGTQIGLPAAAGGAMPSVPGGEVRETNYTYDKLNRLKTTSLAGVRTGAWNGSSYVTSVTTLATSFDYDANGNVVKTTDGNGGTIFSYYDKIGRKTRQVDQEKHVTGWLYDAEGNVTHERRWAQKTGYAGLDGWWDPAVAADDRVTDFTYDRNGRRLTETRSGVVTHGVDGNGNLYGASSTVTIGYAYNGLGQVTRKTEAAGDYTDYAYDATGRLVTETRAPFVDQTGTWVRPTVRYGYNGLNDLMLTRQGREAMSGSDRLTRYVYGAGGRLESMTDASGAVRSYSYDAAGNVVRESYSRLKSDGSSVQEGILYTRDLLGRTTGQAIGAWNGWSWAKGDVQDMAYNAYGEVSQRGLNGGWQEQFAYDGAGRVWRSNSGDGVWRYFVHDANGNQTLSLESEGTNLAGLSLDQALSTATAGGAYSVGGAYIDGINAAINVFDKRGQAIETRLPKRQLNETGTIVDLAISRGYNAFGEVAWERDAKNNQTNYAYNNMGRTLWVQRPTVSITLEDGSKQNVTPTDYFFYDVSGRLVGMQDANGNRTTRSLIAGTGHNGSEALVAREYHADGGSIRSDYDVFGDKRVSWDELSRRTDMSYDAMGRLTQMAKPGGLVDYYAYDLLGQRIQHWNNVFQIPVYGPPEDVWVEDPGYWDYYYGWVGGGGHWETQTPIIGYAPEKELTDYDLQGRVTRQVAFGGDTTTISYAWNGGIAASGLGTFGGWTQTTTMANGRSSTEQTDLFGRQVYKSDLGGHASTFGYDLAGRMTQKSGGGETLTYSYLNTGLVGSASSGWGSGYGSDYELLKTVYGYDQTGNKTSEVYTKEGGRWETRYEPYYDPYYYGYYDPYYYSYQEYVTYGDTYQNATASYDALGRMTSWAESGNGTTPASSIQYEYDAVGNVRRTYAQYRTLDAHGTASSWASTQDHWYRYDAMNRVVTAKGMLSGGQIVRGYNGTDYAYDQAGQRVRASRTTQAWASVSNPNYDPYYNQNPYYDPYYGYYGYQDPYYNYDPYYQDPYITTYYEAEQREDYGYDSAGNLSTVHVGQSGYYDNYDGTVTVTAPPAIGELKGSYTHDTLGRLTRQIDWLWSGNAAYDRTVSYNGKGQISSETVVSKQGADTHTTYSYNDYGYGANYALGAVVSTSSSHYKNGSYQNGSSSSTSYYWYDGAVQASVSNKPNTSQSTTYTTTYSYSGSGALSSIYIGDGRSRWITFTNDMNGQAIRRDESDYNYSSGDPHEVWYRFAGKQLGYTGNNGTLDTDYQGSINNRTRTSGTGAFKFGSTYASTHADFDLSVDPINSYGQGGAGGSHTVRTGETLASIAAQLWGDSSLWYKLAEANGMSAANALSEGQRLNIPAGVMKSRHNAGTFKPYDPAGVIGDTSPVSPQPTSGGGKKNKCGVLGAVLLVVIAVAVTVVTAGAAAAALAPSIGSLGAGIGAVMGGTLATTAGIGLGGAIAIGAGAAAVGSIVSQGIGVATGLQDRFSWKAVGMAAISGGVGAGIGGSGLFDGIKSGVVRAGASAMTSSALTQGLGVVTGLQPKFSWAGVAAAGVGAMVSYEAGKLFGAKSFFNHFENDQFVAGDTSFVNHLAHLGTSAASMIAEAATRSVIEGTDFGDNIMAALPGVIGQTIGDAMMRGIGNSLEKARFNRITSELDKLMKEGVSDEIADVQDVAADPAISDDAVESAAAAPPPPPPPPPTIQDGINLIARSRFGRTRAGRWVLRELRELAKSGSIVVHSYGTGSRTRGEWIQGSKPGKGTLRVSSTMATNVNSLASELVHEATHALIFAELMRSGVRASAIRNSIEQEAITNGYQIQLYREQRRSGWRDPELERRLRASNRGQLRNDIISRYPRAPISLR